MNFQLTRHNEVGSANHGWLHARHYFSFANYYNPKKMGFGKLRVINDDKIEAGMGFGTHPHRDMEIITIPLSGALSHKDSTGNKGTIRKGEVQVMSAGTGVSHSEFNGSNDEELTLFQIWIEPNQLRVKPRYDQRDFDFQSNFNQWTQLVSPIERSEDGLKIHQDAWINACSLQVDKAISYELKKPTNGVFVLVAEGEIKISDQVLQRRDAVGITQVESLQIKANKDSEIYLFEVPLT